MAVLSPGRKLRFAGRTLRNIVRGKPITVAFELTYNCNANCKHCDLGAYVKEPGLGPESYAPWITELKPAVVLISGGEPLLRKNVVEIVRALRRRDPLPVFALTSNGQLLTEEKYLRLREAGMDQFSVSLDYPDERQNEFRVLRNNFEHLRELLPRLARHRNNDIILACVVQSDNFRDLPRIAELALQWGISVNYSTYHAVRTGNMEYLINSQGDLDELRRVVDRLLSMQAEGYPIVTTEWTFRRMIRFFETGRQPDCRAGRRFLIVNPWAQLSPCGMYRDRYNSQTELVREFSDNNTCTECFTTIRSDSEGSPLRLFLNAVARVRLQ